MLPLGGGLDHRYPSQVKIGGAQVLLKKETCVKRIFSPLCIKAIIALIEMFKLEKLNKFFPGCFKALFKLEEQRPGQL